VVLAEPHRFSFGCYISRADPVLIEIAGSDRNRLSCLDAIQNSCGEVEMSERSSQNSVNSSTRDPDSEHRQPVGFRLKQFWQELTNRWKNWTGDRELDIAIRRHLSDQGYQGGGAELKQVKLIAVQRPGWVQVYRFEAVARRQVIDELENESASATPPSHSVTSGSQLLYGLVRDDGRFGCEVQTFIHPARRIELFKQWSEGLITLRGAFNTHT